MPEEAQLRDAPGLPGMSQYMEEAVKESVSEHVLQRAVQEEDADLVPDARQEPFAMKPSFAFQQM